MVQPAICSARYKGLRTSGIQGMLWREDATDSRSVSTLPSSKLSMSRQRNGEFLPLKHEIVLGNPTTYTTTYVAIWATGSREPATDPISGLSSAASTIGGTGRVLGLRVPPDGLGP
ncbi:hypothetical protein NUW54_g10584 [Trametes sanguinea]|uniref:Uncharacterized protein n=1 Tax=Trametes sanguinea TaxID=158606 RepID=A0ACC1NX90_9APHY|nr:hypothetical protein NUW54_g10584 [Trametes sanguinea]